MNQISTRPLGQTGLNVTEAGLGRAFDGVHGVDYSRQKKSVWVE